MQTIKPNDNIVCGKHVPAYKNTWMMSRLNSDATEESIGIWEDEVYFSNRDTKEILHRVGHVSLNDGTKTFHYDEAIRDNLFPVRVMKKNEINDEVLLDVHYEDNLITGRRYFIIEGSETDEKLSAKFSFQLTEPVFEWHLWGILISGFPLKENYSAKFLAHDPTGFSLSPFRWIYLEVTGTETISAGKWGMVECNVVKVRDESLWTIWISKGKSTAPILQIKIVDPKGHTRFWRSI